MRNVFLSLVVVAVLVAGAAGGTLAGWSDSEISYDNYVETGSLDLKVNGQDDLPWGSGVPAKVNCECIVPCCYNCWSEVIDVWNAGQCCPGEVFIHFKEFCCTDVPPEKNGYPSPTSGILCPEPELVAQFGGLVDQIWVDGIGDIDCFLSQHLDVTIYEVDCGTGDIGAVILGPVKIAELESLQLSLGILEPCEPLCIIMQFHLQQIEDPDWPGHPKFKDWPSNALMKDAMMFNIEFDLLQVEKAD
jgi:predicted ribosomally synthesized peptide with SipW-like signal peptide